MYNVKSSFIEHEMFVKGQRHIRRFENNTRTWGRSMVIIEGKLFTSHNKYLYSYALGIIETGFK